PLELQDRFVTLIGLLGSSLPIASLHSDFAGCPEDIQVEEADEAALQDLAKSLIPHLLIQGTKASGISDALKQIPPFSSTWNIAQPIIESVIRESQLNV